MIGTAYKLLDCLVFHFIGFAITCSQSFTLYAIWLFSEWNIAAILHVPEFVKKSTRPATTASAAATATTAANYCPTPNATTEDSHA